jgi:hypothetical protein
MIHVMYQVLVPANAASTNTTLQSASMQWLLFHARAAQGRDDTNAFGQKATEVVSGVHLRLQQNQLIWVLARLCDWVHVRPIVARNRDLLVFMMRHLQLMDDTALQADNSLNVLRVLCARMLSSVLPLVPASALPRPTEALVNRLLELVGAGVSNTALAQDSTTSCTLARSLIASFKVVPKQTMTTNFSPVFVQAIKTSVDTLQKGMTDVALWADPLVRTRILGALAIMGGQEQGVLREGGKASAVQDGRCLSGTVVALCGDTAVLRLDDCDITVPTASCAPLDSSPSALLFMDAATVQSVITTLLTVVIQQYSMLTLPPVVPQSVTLDRATHDFLVNLQRLSVGIVGNVCQHRPQVSVGLIQHTPGVVDWLCQHAWPKQFVSSTKVPLEPSNLQAVGQVRLCRRLFCVRVTHTHFRYYRC